MSKLGLNVTFAGVQTSTETDTVEVAKKRSSCESLARDQEADEFVKITEQTEKFEGVQSDEIHFSERRKCFERPKGIETDAVHPTAGEDVVERSEDADDDAVYPREDTRDDEKSGSAGINVAHPKKANTDFERLEGAHSTEVKKNDEKSKVAENEAVHLVEGKDVKKLKCEKKDVVNPKEREEEVEDAKTNTTHSRPEGPESDEAHSIEGEIEVDKPKGAKNEPAQPSVGQKDVEKSKSVKNDAIDPSEGLKEVKKSEGVESGAAHPKEGKRDFNKSKDSRKDAVYPSEGEKDIQKSKGADGVTAHHNEEKKDDGKPKHAENDLAHRSTEKKDVDMSTGAEDNAAHSRKKKEDVDKPTGADDNKAQSSEERKDREKTKRAENEAIHFSGGKKDVEQTQGANAVHSSKRKEDAKNSSSSKNVESMTVIFHALLTPTFNINFQQGDKVVLRGGPPFSWNHPGQQIEMQPTRYTSLSCYVFFYFSHYISNYPKDWHIIHCSGEKNLQFTVPVVTCRKMLNQPERKPY